MQAKNERQQAMQKEPVAYQNPVVVALLLLLVGGSVSLHQFKVPPIMETVGASVNLSSQGTSWLMTIFTLVAMVLALPASSWLRKIPGKKVLTLAALLVGVGSVIGGVFANAPMLMISRGIEGVGYLLVSISLPLVAVTHADPKKIGLVMGLATIWISGGQIIAMLVTPVLARVLSWQNIWLVYAAFTCLATLLFAVGLTPINKEMKAAKVEKGLRRAFSNKNFIYCCLGLLLFNCSLMMVVTFFMGYVTQNGIVEPQFASAMAAMPTTLGLLGSPVLGSLSDKFGTKKLYAVAVLCVGMGAIMMFVPNMPVLIVGIVLMGLIGCAAPSLFYASLPRVIDPALKEPSNGIAVLFQNVGMVIATLCFSPLLATVGGNYTLAALFLLPLVLVVTFLVSRVRYWKADVA